MDEAQFNVMDERDLVSEASDLGNRHLQPFMDNNCPVLGFGVNFKGKELRFWMVKEEVNNEQEILAWHYIVTSETKAKYPEFKDWTATIFND